MGEVLLVPLVQEEGTCWVVTEGQHGCVPPASTSQSTDSVMRVCVCVYAGVYMYGSTIISEKLTYLSDLMCLTVHYIHFSCIQKGLQQSGFPMIVVTQ